MSCRLNHYRSQHRDHRIELIWVFGFISISNQGAAQGIVLSMIADLKREYSNIFSHTILIANETPGPIHNPVTIHHINDKGTAIKILKYWWLRYGLSIDLFGFEIHIIPGLADGSLDISAEEYRVIRERASRRNQIFIYNQSFLSPETAKRLSEYKSCFLGMAPLEFVQSHYNVIYCLLRQAAITVERDADMQVQSKTTLRKPVYPYYYGQMDRTNKDKQFMIDDKAANKIRIFTSYAAIEACSLQEFSELFVKLTLKHELNWIVLGSTENTIEKVRSLAHSSGSEEVEKILERINFLGRIEKLDSFIQQSCDIFYKGTHTGNATIVSACIHAGVPVVDYIWSDSQIFLTPSVLSSELTGASLRLDTLLLSRRARSLFAREQKRQLDAHNDAWVRQFAKHLVLTFI